MRKLLLFVAFGAIGFGCELSPDQYLSQTGRQESETFRIFPDDSTKDKYFEVMMTAARDMQENNLVVIKHSAYYVEVKENEDTTTERAFSNFIPFVFHPVFISESGENHKSYPELDSLHHSHTIKNPLDTLPHIGILEVIRDDLFLGGTASKRTKKERYRYPTYHHKKGGHAVEFELNLTETNFAIDPKNKNNFLSYIFMLTPDFPHTKFHYIESTYAQGLHASSQPLPIPRD